ncbi:phage tail assembly chaperone [Aromatoleum toluolicum]|uniref:Tail assembly chaperone n=1 Tax=Aromatoleum toluolicum TaxID=90060 RepID=A0ABX1NGF8_9RHOO|nr:phage tail assembly chaperone [Aromatoleum toluolicum]NMF98386.1 phage tail assembly chaperone [Aromatoleum toluolicum]
MANKVKLGQRPKSFKPMAVSFPMPEGGEGTISCSFKYRTRTEFGQFIDRLFEEAGEERPVDDKFSMERLMEKTKGKNAEYLMDALDSWDLDEPISLETLTQLSDELPAAVTSMMERYRSAAVEGRLGN